MVDMWVCWYIESQYVFRYRLVGCCCFVTSPITSRFAALLLQLPAGAVWTERGGLQLFVVLVDWFPLCWSQFCYRIRFLGGFSFGFGVGERCHLLLGPLYCTLFPLWVTIMHCNSMINSRNTAIMELLFIVLLINVESPLFRKMISSNFAFLWQCWFQLSL